MQGEGPNPELRSEKEYERVIGLKGQIERLEAQGASRLTPSMKKLLLRVGWLNRRAVFDLGLKIPSLIGSERALKFRFLRLMVRSLKNLQYLRFAAANGTVTNRTWFDESDFDKVLAKDDVLEIVRLALALSSEKQKAEYAGAILTELHSFFATKGEQIQIVRTFGPWGTHDLLDISH